MVLVVVAVWAAVMVAGRRRVAHDDLQAASIKEREGESRGTGAAEAIDVGVLSDIHRSSNIHCLGHAFIRLVSLAWPQNKENV